MGYGLPAAIGAAIACPGKKVIAISGDGSLQMNIQELATVSYYKVPVKIVLLDNSYLGMVRQWQQLFFDKRYAYTDIGGGNPDFIKLAEAYRLPARQVTKPQEIIPALQEALAAEGPFLVDIKVDREENVLPMVPPGGQLNKMVMGG